jgi:CheY-like chemotaxis protein
MIFLERFLDFRFRMVFFWPLHFAFTLSRRAFPTVVKAATIYESSSVRLTVWRIIMKIVGRILIADDDDSILRTTAILLEEEGYKCDTTRDAQGALEFLNQNHYDLLISDWRMSGNADLEMLATMRDLDMHVPVIIITGYPHVADTIRRKKLSVFALLAKPYDFDELLRKVDAGVAYGRACCTESQAE